MDLGFESLRDRHLIMKEINYRLFSSKDKQSVLELWKTCNLIVSWNDPEKDILRKLSVRDDLFILAEINKKIVENRLSKNKFICKKYKCASKIFL